MDDLNLLSCSVPDATLLLTRCTTALEWAGMKFRSDKSRSIVLVKGWSMNTSPFFIGEESNSIPSIQSMPIKFLGRTVDGSLSDRKSVKELEDKLLSGLKLIHKSSFNSHQKLWILNHLLLPRIQWPLLIYEVPMSAATKLEAKVSVYMRKWLKLHHSLTNLCFYSKLSPCPLPTKSNIYFKIFKDKRPPSS